MRDEADPRWLNGLPAVGEIHDGRHTTTQRGNLGIQGAGRDGPAQMHESLICEDGRA
jgi:hypothetical protein